MKRIEHKNIILSIKIFPTPERKWHPISQILKDKIKNANKDEDLNLNKKYNWKIKKEENKSPE